MPSKSNSNAARAELYCPKCQCQVKPLKGIVNYYCPKCGTTFVASQVEREESPTEDTND